MRTTIELKDRHRARLLELAARRGQKGFSDVIAEAIEAYLDSLAKTDELRQAALRLRGRFSAKDADELRQATRSLRESWR